MVWPVWANLVGVVDLGELVGFTGFGGLASFGGLDGLGKAKGPNSNQNFVTHLMTMPQAAGKNLHSKNLAFQNSSIPNPHSAKAFDYQIRGWWRVD